MLAIILCTLGRRPRRAAVLLGSYCFLFGIGFVITNAFRSGTPEYTTALNVVSVTYPFLGLATFALAFELPSRPARDERPAIWAGLAVALSWIGAESLYSVTNLDAFETGYNFGIGDATIFALLGSAVVNGGAFGLLTVWCLRYPRMARDDPLGTTRLALLTAALAIYLAFSAGSDAFNGPDANYYPFGLAALIVWVVLAGAWIARLHAPPARAARGVAWLILLMLLAGMVCVALLGRGEPFLRTGAVGIARSVGWAVLVFAIVRTRVVEFDLTFAAQRRGTVAAVSLASLFIVAQIMQNFLAEEWGLIAGGVVAGALLFVAAPIQRATERMLHGPERAAPSAAPADEEAFRNAVRLALRGGISREEELQLSQLADRLGLSYARALGIIVAEERQARTKRPPDPGRAGTR